jgi:peptidoglycan/LPS O-acetylase OafA/YrhL
MPVVGGYLIFWFAFLKETPRLNRINVGRDLSYGIYLYAWPVQSLLIYFVLGISPIAVMALATIATSTLALLSWHLIEKPMLALKRIGRRSVSLPVSLR